MQVLLIEDTAGPSLALSRLLEGAGYRVPLAQDGEDGLAFAGI